MGDIATVLLQIKQLEREYKEDIVLSLFYTQPQKNVFVFLLFSMPKFLD